jgi:putative membrane protein
MDMTEQESADAQSGPNTATRLAYERTRLAYERTMMAWVRTGTSLITFGFSVYKFFQLESRGEQIGQPLMGARGFALVLIGVGLLSLWLGYIEYRRDMGAMRADFPGLRRSSSSIVAIFVGVLGVCALLAAILRV